MVLFSPPPYDFSTFFLNFLAFLQLIYIVHAHVLHNTITSLLFVYDKIVLCIVEV